MFSVPGPFSLRELPRSHLGGACACPGPLYAPRVSHPAGDPAPSIWVMKSGHKLAPSCRALGLTRKGGAHVIGGGGPRGAGAGCCRESPQSVRCGTITIINPINPSRSGRGLCTAVAVTATGPAALCAGDFNSEEMRLYEALLPHLARAAHIQRRFAFLQSLSNSSLAVLDTVPAAVMLLDASARALHGNAAADAELRRADPFKLGPSGEIRVCGAPLAQAAVR